MEPPGHHPSTMTRDEDYCLSCPVTELISEEKKPSLYSLSLTDSVCSGSTSTMDLDIMEQPQMTSTLLRTSSNEDTFQSCDKALEESLIVSSGNLHNKFRKSMSLHDVSTMIPSQLIPKSVNTVSCETIQSQSLSSTTKSKDSGFHRSVSCLSLTSGKRNYDHIESKVKAYIRNIKETEALRKKNKLKQQSELDKGNNSELALADDGSEFITDKEDLLIKVQELKRELYEKSLYIDAQQKNYNSLLLKYAEAKNTIDALRLQRISLNYSSVNESQNMSSTNQHINYDFFIQELGNKKSSHTESFKNCTNDEARVFTGKYSEQSQHSVSSISNNSIIEDFKPRKHSTPDKSEVYKCLSPVSKLFSSSSRLDRAFTPLVKTQGSGSHFNTGSASVLNRATESPNKSLNKKPKLPSTTALMNNGHHFKLKQSENIILEKKPSRHIGLPNDRPNAFEKVTKWRQTSFPNINLLGSNSSPDHESEHHEDICSLLSQELGAKCKISEVRVGPDHASRNTTNSKSHYRYCVDDDTSRRGRTKTNFKSEKNKKTKKSVTCKVSNQTDKRSAYVIVSKSKVLTKAVRDDSISEGESHSYNPRSSISYTDHEAFNSDSSDNTNDSSSPSSSVLTSSPPSPSRKSKRKHMQNKSNILWANPKLCSNTRTCSNFALREPILNVTIHADRLSKLTDHRSLENLSTLKNKFNLTPPNVNTESSQRKAWNARNDTNFYVCKDFDLKKNSSLQKSNSLQNCITVMEGMVKKSSALLGDMMDRSICK